MPESISELVALLVGLVVLSLLWRSLGTSGELGRGRGRQVGHGHAMKSGATRSPRG